MGQDGDRAGQGQDDTGNAPVAPPYQFTGYQQPAGYPPAGFFHPGHQFPGIPGYQGGLYPAAAHDQAGTSSGATTQPGPYPPYPPYGYGAPPGAAVGAGGPVPPPRPYDMPYYKLGTSPASSAPWAGGGPVGTGVIPPDVEAQVLHEFADRVVRHGFVRKVFGIVAVQLAITVGFSFVCLFVTPIKAYVRSTPWPFYLSWGLSFGLLLVISCNERLRRKYPANMLFLSLFTLAEAFLVGMITSFFDIEAVAIAFLTTCVAVTVLAVIACQTRVDITSWGSMLAVSGMVLIVLVFLGVFWISKVFYLVIAGVAALLTAVYLVYDLQLIMGGKQYAISPDEYVFAALSLYLDVVQLFLWTLYLVGWARD